MRKIRILMGRRHPNRRDGHPDEPAVADAVQEITEAVLDHCMRFRGRVLNAPVSLQEIADESDALHEIYKDDPRINKADSD